LARLWERLVAPSPLLVRLSDRMRARLLAGLLAVIVVGGFASGVVQLAVIPGFLPTFLAMCGALVVLAAGYASSRTRHYRVGGAIAALAPLVACLSVAALNPDDRVWYAFMSISVLLAAVFLSLRATAAVAGLSILGILLLLALVPALRPLDRSLPPLAFHAIFSPLMLLAARHRDRLEAAERRLQEQLLQAQKLESVGRLAGGVAHDFNNLLMGILGYAEFLEEGIRAGAPELEDLAEIRRAGERARDLTRQLLAVARKQVTEPGVLDLNEVLRESEKLLRRVLGEDVELVVTLAPDPWPVMADPTQLQQVILNLAVNARDAMPHGGRLVLETGNLEVDARHAAAHPGLRPGPHVRLAVSDSGQGMSPETRAHAFEPFYTTKPVGEGTGLGLATVYGIVTQAGGHVGVESEPGRGTRFDIYLPRTSEVRLPLTPPPHRSSRRGNETVLVVEDEPSVRELTVRTLRAGGYRVLAASNGREALDVVARSPQGFHLLLTDVVMPDMGGRQLADTLLSGRPDLAVLFVSGHAEDVIAHHGVLDPGVHFLAKPFTPAALQEKVRSLLDGR
jgi:signal transduction histidine kinase/CheY-like chemotaxis protein